MSINNGIMSSNSNDWETPQWLFDDLDKEFVFTLDPCATRKNKKCVIYFTKKDDGLKQSWNYHRVFVNPPYGREIGKWVEKSYKASQQPYTIVVMLIPSRTDTKYWHEYIMKSKEIRFIKGRLKFSNSNNSAPFPSAIVIFDGHDNSPKIVSYKR